MTLTGFFCAALVLMAAGSMLFGQDGAAQQPLYRVTIVSRTTKAVNYGHRSEPSTIGFAGTPLMPEARGKAFVEAKPGATVVQARFSHVEPPTRFGAGYLTYVVWAISPDGRPQNLGELTLDSGNKGKLTASTNLQTFALIVTAEPHFSVAQPSDVVVMENVVGPETFGKVEDVNATYELLPRKGYTYDPAAQPGQEGRSVSRGEYDRILAQYQAQNAIQLAESEGAAQYAGSTLSRAQELWQQAQAYPKSQHNAAISTAREATQVAEDARRIAKQRAAAERTAALQVRTAEEVPPPPATPPSPEESMTEPPVDTPAIVAPAPPPPAATEAPRSNNDSAARENRRAMVQTLQRRLETIDSPRGVIVILPSSITQTGALPGVARSIADAIRAYPGLRIEVEGHSDKTDDPQATREDAEAVRQALASAGIAPETIVARGLGSARPRGPNVSGSAAIQNERIEVVIRGEAIGNMAAWDHPYELGKTAVTR